MFTYFYYFIYLFHFIYYSIVVADLRCVRADQDMTDARFLSEVSSGKSMFHDEQRGLLLSALSAPAPKSLSQNTTGSVTIKRHALARPPEAIHKTRTHTIEREPQTLRLMDKT